MKWKLVRDCGVAGVVVYVRDGGKAMAEHLEAGEWTVSKILWKLLWVRWSVAATCTLG